MKKLNKSMLDLVNEVEYIVKAEFSRINFKLHPVDTVLLVGDPAQTIGVVTVLQWSRNTDYVQVEHLDSGETMWLHSISLNVLDVIKRVSPVDGVARKSVAEKNIEDDIEEAVKGWREEFGKYEPTSRGMDTSMGVSMGNLTGLRVHDAPTFDINKTKPVKETELSTTGIKRTSCMGPSRIEGKFPEFSKVGDVIITLDTNNNIKSVEHLSGGVIKLDKSYHLKLSNGIYHITDIPETDGSITQKNEDKND